MVQCQRSITTALIGEEPLVLRSFEALLDLEDDLRIIPVSELEEVLDMMRLVTPDVVVINVAELPSGLDAVARIRAVDAAATVLAVTGRSTPDDVDTALSAGCRGMLWRAAPTADLAQAIRRVHGGEWVYDSSDLLTLMRARESRAHTPTAPVDDVGLSDREVQVLQLLTDGRATHEIASDLFLSIHTIRNHIRRIMQKLGVSTRAAAVVAGIESGTVTSGVSSTSR